MEYKPKMTAKEFLAFHAKNSTGKKAKKPSGHWASNAIQGYRDIGGQRIYFKSKSEANYARICQFELEQGVINGWAYEPIEYDLGSNYRRNRFYKPDFLKDMLDESWKFVEVKGRMDNNSRILLNRMAKHNPSITVEVLYSKEVTAIGRQVAALIPGWE